MIKFQVVSLNKMILSNYWAKNSVTDVPEILLVYFRYKYDDGSSDNAWISYHEFLYYCKHREVLDAWPYEERQHFH